MVPQLWQTSGSPRRSPGTSRLTSRNLNGLAPGKNPVGVIFRSGVTWMELDGKLTQVLLLKSSRKLACSLSAPLDGQNAPCVFFGRQTTTSALDSGWQMPANDVG